MSDDLLSFDTTLPTSCPGLSAGRALKEMMFRMSKQLTYIIVLLFMVTLLAAQTAIADPVTVELAEKTPPVTLVEGQDPGDPTMAGLPPTTTTTTTTTSTTTTLPIVPRCPDGPVPVGAKGEGWWRFDDDSVCLGGTGRIDCYEASGFVASDSMDWTTLADCPNPGDCFTDGTIRGLWNDFVASLPGIIANRPEDCFVCSCVRGIGCFPPGVKITMADGSFRNIQNVRAGDAVRNAKTGLPVTVAQVIEGPEALPLIRFGFDDTTVTTSQAHPVLTATGLKPANELTKGDTVFDAEGHPHALTTLETLPIEEGQRVINVSLDVPSSDDADGRLIVSDGIVTGDIVLQGLLKERKIDAR